MLYSFHKKKKKTLDISLKDNLCFCVVSMPQLLHRAAQYDAV